jgi:hypothetical protein
MLSFYYFPMKNNTDGNVTEQECENPLKGLIYFIIFLFTICDKDFFQIKIIIVSFYNL